MTLALVSLLSFQSRPLELTQQRLQQQKTQLSTAYCRLLSSMNSVSLFSFLSAFYKLFSSAAPRDTYACHILPMSLISAIKCLAYPHVRTAIYIRKQLIYRDTPFPRLWAGCISNKEVEVGGWETRFRWPRGLRLKLAWPRHQSAWLLPLTVSGSLGSLGESNRAVHL